MTISQAQLDSMLDETLAQQACHTPAAFAKLYSRYLNQVYRYHFVRTGNAHDAQDLTTQTFTAALEGIARYRGRGAFAAWLMTIARNKAMDYFRAQKPEVPLETLDEHLVADSSLEEAAVRRIELAQVTQALRGLARERAEALTLRIFGGLSMAEAARVMGKSEAAVKMLVYRALQDLKTMLQPTISTEDL